MQNSRLETLLRFAEENPEDAFTIYALGLEYLQEDKEKARSYFEKILQFDPDYVPVYYQLAKLYESLEEFEKAKNTYLQGIKLSQNKGDSLAQRELKNAYHLLLFEME